MCGMVPKTAVVAIAVLAVVIGGSRQAASAASTGAPVTQAGHQAALPAAARQSPGADAKALAAKLGHDAATPASTAKPTPAADTKAPAAKAPEAKPTHDAATPASTAKPAHVAESPAKKAAARADSQAAVTETVSRIRAMMAVEQAAKSAKATPGKAVSGGTTQSRIVFPATPVAARTSPESRQAPGPGGVRLLWDIPPVPGGIRLSWEGDLAPRTAITTAGPGVRLQWPPR
ncbi:MAG: hypothetical protein NT151_03795 [Acidobacteria bacterium]|nr:hypothetical protein [Acidobacteriota bacterium]